MSTLEILAQQMINGLMLGMMYSIIAVGFTLYFGVLDIINFSHGDFYMLGAFIALILYSIADAAGWLVSPLFVLVYLFLGSMILTGMVGVVAERLFVKPVSKAPLLISLLVTLGLGTVIREAVRIFYPRGADPKHFPTLLPTGSFELGHVIIRYDSLIIFGLGVISIVLTSLLTNRTRIGSAIRAVAQDGEAAMMMGVNLDLTVDITFFIGSALAAMAGIMNGLYYRTVMFNIGGMAGVIGFSAAVMGGLGNIYGAIVGGMLFGLLETFFAAVIPFGAENKRVFAFLIVILFMIFKPTGILGEKVYERV